MSETNAQTVLVIDDSRDIHDLVGARLRSERLNLVHACDAVEGADLASRHLPDLILLDLDMPGTDGMTLCRQFKDDATLREIPVIFLTGNIDVATKVQAFELGAVDYVTKPFDAIELKARVRAALRTKRYHDLLTNRARIDALTGLWNRGYLDDQLAIEVSLLARKDRPVALILADIDHFKAINDHHGHPFGDGVIQRVAETFRDVSREGDVVCRYGGEEFALVLRDTRHDPAVTLAERLRTEVAALEFWSGRKPVPVSASFGVTASTHFDDPAQVSPGALVEAADAALYRAKSGGRNRVESS
jgi:two-component system, cell cycle response regulator